MQNPQKQFWDERFKEGAEYFPLNEIYFDRIVSPLLEFSQHPKFLDIGCGTGQALELLHSRGFAVDGWDISSIALQKVSERLQGKIVDLMEVDLNDANFSLPNKKYDFVLMKLVLAFVGKDKRKEVLQGVRSLLKETGAFLVISPVTYPGIVYRNPKIEKISIPEEELLKDLRSVFGNVKTLHHDFSQEQSVVGHFLCN